MSPVHPLVEGLEEICYRHRAAAHSNPLFNQIYERIHANWIKYHEPERWPSASNWVLRVAREYTPDPSRRLEKQLQKEIAICLENDGWGNDIPTASGLVNSRGRGMNIDLGHRVTNGFELVELKLTANTPYEAGCQMLRYAATYLLYRLEPELARRFKTHEMIRAKRIVLEVLAPHSYYAYSDIELPSFEAQLANELAKFTKQHLPSLSMSFRFVAFPVGFVYQPGMDCELIRGAIHRRVSLFANSTEPESKLPRIDQTPRRVEIRGHRGELIQSFADWKEHALPPDRKYHWQEGRSELELARSWTRRGEPSLPEELHSLLESHEGTKGTVIKSGQTQSETALPFTVYGPRCHDLTLKAERDGYFTVISVEAKADETFGRTVEEELQMAIDRPTTTFPERLDWLTRSMLGIPAFEDRQSLVLSRVVADLYYQLLTATAGVLLEAQIQSATTAILMIHEFRTTATEEARLIANANALNAFLTLFYSRNGGPDEDVLLQPGKLLGPISISERPLAGAPRIPSEIPLFIGKIRTDRVVPLPAP